MKFIEFERLINFDNVNYIELDIDLSQINKTKEEDNKPMYNVKDGGKPFVINIYFNNDKSMKYSYKNEKERNDHYKHLISLLCND